MPLSDNTHEWLNWVVITSIPLRRIDESGQVIGNASGTLIDYRGRRFLLSVEHAVNLGTGGWAIQLGHDRNHGTEVFYLKGFAYPGEFTRSTKAMRGLDLCVTEVPHDLESQYEYRTPRGLFDQRPHHVFQPDLTLTPNPQDLFAFSGRVRTETHGANCFVSEMVVYPGLRLLRTEEEFHIFALPVAHPGHDAFQGCSGSPIVDRDKQVVALVVDGDIPTNTIRGISLGRCIPVLNFLCGGDRGT